MLDWILDHLFTLIIVASVVAQLMKAIRGRKGERDEGSAPMGDADGEKTFSDPDLAERTRRIREEIQRKIAERQRAGRGGQMAQPPVLPPQPVAEETVPTYEEPPPLPREVVVSKPVYGEATTHRWDTERAAEILEQQNAMAEQLRSLEDMRAAAARRTAFEERTQDHEDKARRKTRGDVLDDLRDRAALRRAFILREVLGPPVGLRR